MARLFSIYRWVSKRYAFDEWWRRFVEAPWAGGAVLLGCVAIAMLLANLPGTADYYSHLLETDLSLRVVSPNKLIDWAFPPGMTVEKLVNDVLMVIFFFSVGLEIKREISHGQLSSVRKAILPVLAAAGGMMAPAIVFAVFNHGTPAANGWGIPTATDIAFAVGVLSMLGNRVPASLKVFLTALAIADDLGAILVITFFYGGQVQWLLLGIAIAILVGLYFLQRSGETRMIFYLVPAIVVWSLFYYSGVHAAISGVAMAMVIPSKSRYNKAAFMEKAQCLRNLVLNREEKEEEFPDEDQRYYLRHMRSLASHSVGLSYRLENALSPYVTFVIMPIFALANAGVRVPSVEYFDIFLATPQIGALGTGIFFGLLAGKPLGIFAASWIAVKTKLAVMPEGSSWRMLWSVACLGGIGFTMSLFVDALAFTDSELVNRGKIAILMGSAAAAIMGSLLIFLFSKKDKR